MNEDFITLVHKDELFHSNHGYKYKTAEIRLFYPMLFQAELMKKAAKTFLRLIVIRKEVVSGIYNVTSLNISALTLRKMLVFNSQ